jgi:hypothetical protein
MKTPTRFIQVTTALLLLSLAGHSQNEQVIISTVTNNDRSVSFNYKKKDFGNFYLTLTFMYLENSFPVSFHGNIKSSQGNLFTLRPTSSLRTIGYSYKYTVIRGELVSGIDTGFVYLLPVSKGKTVSLYKQVIIDDEFSDNSEIKDMKSFIFRTEPGDTVFSSRKGLVVEVFDENTSTQPISVSKESNPYYILIEHDDGTLARYFMLEKNSIWVKPGQEILPHTPLALAGTLNPGSNKMIGLSISAIGFSVYYLNKAPLEKTENSTILKDKNYHNFVNTLFHTTEGDVHLKELQNYTAVFTPEHIIKELSKKEKKKIGY